MDLLRALGTRKHLMRGAASGLVYAEILTVLDPSSDGGATALGLVIGLVHGLIVTMSMSMMLAMAHPLVRDGEVERRGGVLTGFGSMTPAGVMMAHAVFGLVASAMVLENPARRRRHDHQQLGEPSLPDTGRRHRRRPHLVGTPTGLRFNSRADRSATLVAGWPRLGGSRPGSLAARGRCRRVGSQHDRGTRCARRAR